MEISEDRPKAVIECHCFFGEKGSQVSHYQDLERTPTRALPRCAKVGEIQLVTDKMVLPESSERPVPTMCSKKKARKLVEEERGFSCGTDPMGRFGGTPKSFLFKQ